MELNRKLAVALAKQYLAAIDPQAMAVYLLTSDVAVALLADRLSKNPTATIGALQQLPARSIAKVPRKKAAVAKKRHAAKTHRQKRRGQMSVETVQQLKGEVLAFLAKNRWASRKHLTDAVALDTQSVYRRIMVELQQERAIVSKGEKSKTVYALKGAAKSSRKKAAKKSAKTEPTA